MDGVARAVLDFLASFLHAAWPLVVGYLYASILGGLVVRSVMKHAMQAPPWRVELEEGEVWHRSALGLVETALAATAVVISQPAIIGAWLVLKASSRWADWPRNPGEFNRFAVGTGLSLGFGAAGGGIVRAIWAEELALAVGCVAGPLIAAGMVWSLYRGPVWWQRVFGSADDASLINSGDDHSLPRNPHGDG